MAGSRPTADSRPSDQPSATITRWPRRRSSSRTLGAEAALDDELARAGVAGIERARERVAVPARRLDRLLQVEAEHEVGEQEDDLPLVLLVAAGRAAGQHGHAVAQHQRRAQRGARPPPGTRLAGRPSSSQHICSRLPSGKPSSGMTGELCSQPPLGVAETMLPQRSTTSRWQVSPRTGPGPVDGRLTDRPAIPGGHRLEPGSDPGSASGMRVRGSRAGRPSGRARAAAPGWPCRRRASGATACSPAASRASSGGAAASPYQASRSAKASFAGLDGEVDAVGVRGSMAVVVVAVEQGQLLQEHGSLAPRPGLVHDDVAEGVRRRLLVAGGERGEVGAA